MKKNDFIDCFNKKLLKYADDIVSINKEVIIDFFRENNINFNERYIDFLAKFGGNFSYFFRKFDFDCTFDSIKSIYLENSASDPLPSDKYCIISNHYILDWFIIEHSTGIIYCAGDIYNEDGICTNAELSFNSIDDFIWIQLYMTYLDKFLIDRKKSSLKKDNIDKYISEKELLDLLEIPYFNLKVLISKNKRKVYFYFFETESLEIHEINYHK